MRRRVVNRQSYMALPHWQWFWSIGNQILCGSVDTVQWLWLCRCVYRSSRQRIDHHITLSWFILLASYSNIDSHVDPTQLPELLCHVFLGFPRLPLTLIAASFFLPTFIPSTCPNRLSVHFLILLIMLRYISFALFGGIHALTRSYVM